MELNFSDEYYKNKALNTKKVNRESNKSVGDAFLLLISEIDPKDLSNLCMMIKEHFELREEPVHLSLEHCYKLTQGVNVGSIIVDEKLKEKMVELAYKCIESGKDLGDKTILDGKINTSSWMSHCLYEGKLAGQLAKKLGINPETAKIQGILHDYGRKADHSLGHVLKGYEKLIDAGWESEAIGCLTHSFLNGGRCASNEQAEIGFFVDDDGNPCWEEGAYKDDITLFLENYQYDEYDSILNIADLMATSEGIVSPFDRIADIATRRTIDPTNRSYFLAEFNNKLVETLKVMGAEISNDVDLKVKASKGVSLDEINEKFKATSDIFYTYYKTYIEKDKPYISSKDIAKADVRLGVTVSEMRDAEGCIKSLGNIKETEGNVQE